MANCGKPAFWAAGLLLFAALQAFAEKVMFYSEKNGIMWVEESQLADLQRNDSLPAVKEKESAAAKSAAAATDPLARARSKDPEVFYKTGQRYFFAGDYAEALRYFENAYQLRRTAEYYLFIAKCHRKLNEPRRMLFVLDAIMQFYPNSEVADDALFEMALYYEMNRNYQAAIDRFKQLAEQYPYGTSITTNQEFRNVAREQIEIMKNELDSLLIVAGLAEGTVSSRLRDWQEINGLPATGFPDQKTVASLIQVRTEREEEAREAVFQREQFLRLRRIAIVGMGAFFLLWIWSLAVSKDLKNCRQRLETMRKTVESLL